MKEVANTIFELRKFSSDIVELGLPATPEMVDAFESENQLALPADYKFFITQINGFSLMGNEVYGLHGKQTASSLEAVHE